MLPLSHYLSRDDALTLEEIGVGFKSKDETWLSIGPDGQLTHSPKPLPMLEAAIHRALAQELSEHYAKSRERKKMSATLREILLPSSDVDPIDVQFLSRDPNVTSFDQLEARFNYKGPPSRDKNYCLVPGEDGRVECIPAAEARMGNHIWTVHFFDLRTGRQLLPNDRLHSSTISKTSYHIGKNVNRGSGNQKIGPVGFNNHDFMNVLSGVGLTFLLMLLFGGPRFNLGNAYTC